jgi:hypothetical protein
MELILFSAGVLLGTAVPLVLLAIAWSRRFRLRMEPAVSHWKRRLYSLALALSGISALIYLTVAYHKLNVVLPLPRFVSAAGVAGIIFCLSAILTALAANLRHGLWLVLSNLWMLLFIKNFTGADEAVFWFISAFSLMVAIFAWLRLLVGRTTGILKRPAIVAMCAATLSVLLIDAVLVYTRLVSPIDDQTFSRIALTSSILSAGGLAFGTYSMWKNQNWFSSTATLLSGGMLVWLILIHQ